MGVLYFLLSGGHVLAQTAEQGGTEANPPTGTSSPTGTWSGTFPSAQRDIVTAPVEAPHDHAKPLTAIGTNIAPSRGPLPPDYASASFARHGAIWDNDGTSRQWLDSWYLWHAPALYHNPLYFEEVNLERYGYGARFGQPVLSAASFFGRIPLLPYLVVAEPPDECVYTLGHYRPGNCVPFQIHRPPISKRGALYQSAVVTSLFFLIP